ncbi:hypothetical protein [Halomonas rhizosphaerae]|uniref:Uncharacterized protein n=1 Tax=Halomonas rhizosphaerae TaxID=3043296 RepID=A0ABT6UV15_9GAMM|nr:hypothetical protein [Halomonas rhizosphaerae]MDI5889795.1 hypothetical protein [Halomonas rhizosphaerae]MDI5921996.1 hypothetical protein [Halomonas rhizosphaerae]
MPAAITDNGAGSHGSRNRCRTTRWWLAGLLVGCLLPASLAQVESLRPVERAAQVSILVPVLLCVRSRLQARRRALVRWVRRAARWPRVAARVVARSALAPCHTVAAHDVLTRRGPPDLR